MTRTLTLALVAAAALAGCNKEDHTIVAGPDVNDPQANVVANLDNVQLPPSISASKTYRCKDNSLVYITFLTDNVTALVRDKQEEPPVATLKAPAPGQAYVFEGYSLSGEGDQVTYKSPDSGSQSCKA